MHSITLAQLASVESIDDIEVHSFDGALYTALLTIDAQEYRLLDNNLQPYRRRSAEQIKQDLLASRIGSKDLVQQSAYH